MWDTAGDGFNVQLTTMARRSLKSNRASSPAGACTSSDMCVLVVACARPTARAPQDQRDEVGETGGSRSTPGIGSVEMIPKFGSLA